MQETFPHIAPGLHRNLNSDCPCYPSPHAHDGLGELDGIIDAAVNIAGSLTTMLIGVFKRPPADSWSVWSYSERKQYVTEALQISTTSVLTGKTLSATDVFRKLIAHVELSDDWYHWKKKNSSFLPAIWQAETEVKQYQTSGYQPGMEYINPEMIKRVLHPASAGMGNIWIWTIGGLVIFGGVKLFNNNKKKQLQ